MGAGASLPSRKRKQTRLPKYADVVDDYIGPRQFVLGEVCFAICVFMLVCINLQLLGTRIELHGAICAACTSQTQCPFNFLFMICSWQDPCGVGQFVKLRERPLISLIEQPAPSAGMRIG